MLRTVIIRIFFGCGAFLVEFSVKLVSALWKRIQPGDPFEINKVIRFLRTFQGVFRRTSPAVRLRAKVGEFGNCAPQKAWHFRRDSLGRNTIYINVPFVPPPECRFLIQ